jgi:hypothetical protein
MERVKREGKERRRIREKGQLQVQGVESILFCYVLKK